VWSTVSNFRFEIWNWFCFVWYSRNSSPPPLVQIPSVLRVRMDDSGRGDARLRFASFVFDLLFVLSALRALCPFLAESALRYLCISQLRLCRSPLASAYLLHWELLSLSTRCCSFTPPPPIRGGELVLFVSKAPNSSPARSSGRRSCVAVIPRSCAFR
jgi:hypothetical protein